ncbi:MAG TPA: hypothetical protein VNE39_22395 [Planctomycetota bacterium]|nr:hypothetical protein [Planctomycetota bacterium]
MHRLRTALALGLAATALAASKEEAPQPATEMASKPILVVLDFESAFDKGGTGRFVAGNFRAKITRYKLFQTVEDMDREDYERQAKFTARFDLSAKDVLAFATKWLQADMVMWGKVEQAGGEQLRVTTRVADRELGPDKLRYEGSIVVPNKYALQVGVFKQLGEMTGREDPRYAPLPPDAEERWAKAPNLIQGEGFETGKDHPDGWERFGVDWQMKEVHWEKNPDADGKCIVMRMSEGVAAMEGDYYFSEFFDIEPGATYRIRFRVKTLAPTCKIFVKYYAWLHTVTEPEGQWREVGRTQINCHTKRGEWVTDQRECHPQIYVTRAQRTYTPKKCRIGLYAYWPAGVAYWDDVVFKKIADAPKAVKPIDVGEVGRRPFERKE